MDDSAKLQLLLDRAAISDVVNCYALAVDSRDWEMLRSCFTDEIEVQMDWWEARGPRTTTADDFIAGVKQLAGFRATQHISSNHVIEIERDDARCLSYLHGMHYLPNPEGENYFILGGYYENDLVRAGEGWKIRRIKLNVTWQAGNRHVFDLAFKANQGAPTPG
jgi:hypothetical protein